MQALSTENRVYVAKVYSATSKSECQIYCTSDPQCNTVTFFDSGSGPNANKCVLNYGPTLGSGKLAPLQNSENLGWTAPRDCGPPK